MHSLYSWIQQKQSDWCSSIETERKDKRPITVTKSPSVCGSGGFFICWKSAKRQSGSFERAPPAATYRRWTGRLFSNIRPMESGVIADCGEGLRSKTPNAAETLERFSITALFCVASSLVYSSTVNIFRRQQHGKRCSGIADVDSLSSMVWSINRTRHGTYRRWREKNSIRITAQSLAAPFLNVYDICRWKVGAPFGRKTTISLQNLSVVISLPSPASIVILLK